MPREIDCTARGRAVQPRHAYDRYSFSKLTQEQACKLCAIGAAITFVLTIQKVGVLRTMLCP